MTKAVYDSVYDLMTSLYEDDQLFQTFCKKFPRILEFSKNVKVIPWQEEFALSDYSEAIAFKEKVGVSFRKEKPSLTVILSVLGHLYFNVADELWSSAYSGGESLFWLILTNKVDGNEETVRNYVKFLEELSQSHLKVQNVLNEAAKEVAKKHGIPVKNALGLCLWSGFVPTLEPGEERIFSLDADQLPDELSKTNCEEIIMYAIEETGYGRKELVSEFLKEVLKEIQKTSRKFSLRP